VIPTESESENWMNELLTVMDKLLSDQGCPWDREQTHSSLKKFLVEECAELLDSIDDKDDVGICEELGDILMHIVFHANIAARDGRFNFDDIAKVIREKMIRRHPHVFGDEKVNHADEVLAVWNRIKAEEKGDRGFTSILDGIPRHMPALLRARELQKKAAKVGFDWEKPEQVIEKIEEELEELKNAYASGDESHVEEEIGDLLFAVVNFSRFRNSIPAEELLAQANKKFIDRFKYIERELEKKEKSLEEATIEEMEELWNEAKKKLEIK
jgi:tetrapyrrole methylase family protein/MazG family protein